MTHILLTIALATIPHTEVVRDECCAIEVNHFHDDEAREVFTQLIAWEFCNDRERVVDWKLVKRDEGKPSIEVKRDYQRGGYVAIWIDGEAFRELRAPCWRETWTQYDPELVNRNHWPQEKRRRLSARSQ